MTIQTTVKGDIVKRAQEGKYKAIVQGCNIFNCMGSGLAPQIARAWPEAQAADNATLAGDVSKIGKFTFHRDQLNDCYIINGYTQAEFGTHKVQVDYGAVANVFRSLNTFIPAINRNSEVYDPRPVGIPMIGAGLAGGHWEAIKIIINLVTPDIELELVEYQP